jgi:hypothetical protein
VAQSLHGAALAAVGILKSRRGEWVSTVDLIRAGIERPAQAVDYAIRQQLAAGARIEVERTPGRFVRYLLVPLPAGREQRDPASPGDRE